jgi:hypothetical protein
VPHGHPDVEALALRAHRRERVAEANALNLGLGETTRADREMLALGVKLDPNRCFRHETVVLDEGLPRALEEAG